MVKTGGRQTRHEAIVIGMLQYNNVVQVAHTLLPSTLLPNCTAWQAVQFGTVVKTMNAMEEV